MKQGITLVGRRIALFLTLSFVIACTPFIKNHGYIPPEEDLARIVVGQDTRTSVQTLVGPPTSGGILNSSGFYYVGSKFRTIGGFEPKEIAREIVAISFDSSDVVTNIERFGLEDGQVVALSRRVTETGIADTTFLSQLFGSIGRFDAGSFVGSN